MPTVSAHVALTLARHIDAVFGVMGNGNAYFLDALETQTDAVFTAVRHEQGGVVAAGPIAETLTAKVLSEAFGMPIVLTQDGGRYAARAA